MAGTITNTAIVDFGTGNADWGTIVGATIHDAITSGNQVAQSALATSKVISADPVTFQIGALAFVLSSEISDYAAIALLNAMFGKTSSWGSLSGVPTTYYIALWTTTPDSAGSGGTECTGTGYGRVAITASSWGAAS